MVDKGRAKFPAFKSILSLYLNKRQLENIENKDHEEWPKMNF